MFVLDNTMTWLDTKERHTKIEEEMGTGEGAQFMTSTLWLQGPSSSPA